ncbi:succinyl-diaminopimelate desuccinylase [Alphaproteobacteria bacterium]|nr:succinyl-diaminopimelate desuccinylase [Alphaproteobacteria bacterium]
MGELSYAVQLAQKLIRCPSVTPEQAGTLDLLETELEGIGFSCTRLSFGEGLNKIENLYAVLGEGPAHFAFAGHVDVVPVGKAEEWQFAPFDAKIKDGNLYGRGAADMKSGIAAFVSAIRQWRNTTKKQTKISLIITGDEEADAVNGTVKMIEWMRQQDIHPDMCVVAEPTSQAEIGDIIKNGRRGSLTGEIAVRGTQGHVAYPHLAHNPTAALIQMLAPVTSVELDGGNDYFTPSTAEVTGFSTSSCVSNVIPATANALFNIRFNTEHTAENLQGWLTEHFQRIATKYQVQFDVEWKSNAAPFVTKAGKLTQIMSEAIFAQTGKHAQLSTAGGTSDARFITYLCPVAEFGLVGKTMHKIDENVAINDIDLLAKIFEDMLHRFDANNEY